MELFYTAHYNWQWVVSAAFEQLARDCPEVISRVEDCKQYRALPSVLAKKTKAEYSLIRADIQDGLDSSMKHKLRMHSLGFADLDPKDALYRRLLAADAANCMPKTQMIPWDAGDEDVPDSLPFIPTMLKAPMGSGGFGLYYVYHKRDILPLLRNHRLRAEREPSFMANLIASYRGVAPCWSLQEVVQSVPGIVPRAEGSSDITNCDSAAPIEELRRTQIRVYLLLCEDELLLFDGIEVRLPQWNCDINNVLVREAAVFARDSLDSSAVEAITTGRRPWVEEVEEECCGEGYARPYNEQRNKSQTERCLLEEISSLASARSAILDCTRRAFTALKPSIFEQHQRSQESSPERKTEEVHMAVLGVDLLVSRSPKEGIASEDTFRAVMVEVNNNPAMPGNGKRMSSLYRAHLVEMVAGIVAVGLQASSKARAEVVEEGSSSQREFGNEKMQSLIRRFQPI